MKTRHLLLLSLIALFRPAWASFQEYAGPDFDAPSYGILLVAQPGGPEWEKMGRQACDAVSADKIPCELVFSGSETRPLQQSIDKLAARRVKKIITVPLFTSSDQPELEQLRYILGIKEKPSRLFMSGAHNKFPGQAIARVNTDLPLLVTRAMDDDNSVEKSVEKLLQAKMADGGTFSAVIVSAGTSSQALNRKQEARLRKLAARLKEEQGLYDCAVAVIDPDIRNRNRPVREKAFAEMPSDTTGPEAGIPRLSRPADSMFAKEMKPPQDTDLSVSGQEPKSMRAKVRSLSLKGKVIVVGHSLDGSELDRIVRNELDGCFYIWAGTATLNKDKIKTWVEDKAKSVEQLPSMRLFRNAPEFSDIGKGKL